ncbi:aryl-alcohol dehydrogenase [Mycena floridula]|nr:aryl-alcohol dehydrogenase [Mycena floridula]
MSTTKSMPYVRLGLSGLKVSKIILGCMSYGSSQWAGWVLPEEEGIKHIKAAYAHNFLDSFSNSGSTYDSPPFSLTNGQANIYSNGESEILRKAIKQHNFPRDEIVVLTKLFMVVGKEPAMRFGFEPADRKKADVADYANQYDLSRKHIFDSVKHSLKRLQLDYIDVLQCHRFDYDTGPIAEMMAALHDCVKAMLDISGCRPAMPGNQSIMSCKVRLCHNQQINTFHFDAEPSHLLYREEEREMFPTLKHFGVGFIPWSPLARGLLTRPLIPVKGGAGTGDTKRGETDPLVAKYTKAGGTPAIIKRVTEVAEKRKISMAQVAIAWSLSKEGVTAPIVGTTSLKNLEDIIAGVNVKLTDEEIEYLEEPYQAQAPVGVA